MMINAESLVAVHTHTHTHTHTHRCLEDREFASFFISKVGYKWLNRNLIMYRVINRAIFVYILLVLLCILGI